MHAHMHMHTFPDFQFSSQPGRGVVRPEPAPPPGWPKGPKEVRYRQVGTSGASRRHATGGP